MKKSRIVIASVILLLAAGLAAFTAYRLMQPQSPIVRTSGTALVGGSFEMIDQDDKTVSEKDFHGKYMLIFFGYTFCPDICPTELQVITGALEQLGDKAKNIQPVFVTIDPERDTPEVMKEYVSNFYPGMIGLTGTAEQLALMARKYRVFYSKAAQAGESADEYTMDHSSILYLMGPDGAFVKHFSYGTDAAKLATSIATATKE